MRPLNASTRRRGFTWVEVLSVLSILVIVMAVILPAIQQAREAARRTQCKNNLKQLGLALHNYHDVTQTFPFGYLLAIDGPYRGWGWGVYIAPYLDCSPFYNGIDFNSGLQYEYNSPDLNRAITAYRCPSDDGSQLLEHAFVVRTDVYEGIVTSGSLDVPRTFNRSNYFGVAGYLHADVGGIDRDRTGEPPSTEPFLNPGSLGNIGIWSKTEHRYCDQQNFRGVFGQNSRVRIKDISDGTSNVIMLGERFTPKTSNAGAVGHGIYLGALDCSTAEGLAMVLGDTSIKMNAGQRSRSQTSGFGSNHIGGSHFLFADGAVNFLADNINIDEYRDLSTIDDSRQIADF